jgi:hypothetical protein
MMLVCGLCKSAAKARADAPSIVIRRRASITSDGIKTSTTDTCRRAHGAETSDQKLHHTSGRLAVQRHPILAVCGDD